MFGNTPTFSPFIPPLLVKRSPESLSAPCLSANHPSCVGRETALQLETGFWRIGVAGWRRPGSRCGRPGRRAVRQAGCAVGAQGGPALASESALFPARWRGPAPLSPTRPLPARGTETLPASASSPGAQVSALDSSQVECSLGLLDSQVLRRPDYTGNASTAGVRVARRETGFVGLVEPRLPSGGEPGPQPVPPSPARAGPSTFASGCRSTFHVPRGGTAPGARAGRGLLRITARR